MVPDGYLHAGPLTVRGCIRPILNREAASSATIPAYAFPIRLESPAPNVLETSLPRLGC